MSRINFDDHSRKTGWPEGMTIFLCGGDGDLPESDIEAVRAQAWRLHDKKPNRIERRAERKAAKALADLRARVAERRNR